MEDVGGSKPHVPCQTEVAELSLRPLHLRLQQRSLTYQHGKSGRNVPSIVTQNGVAFSFNYLMLHQQVVFKKKKKREIKENMYTYVL